MTVYEFIARYRAADDLEIIIHNVNDGRNRDNDIQTTAFSVQENDPVNGIPFEVYNAYVDTWNYESGTMWIDMEIM